MCRTFISCDWPDSILKSKEDFTLDGDQPVQESRTYIQLIEKGIFFFFMTWNLYFKLQRSFFQLSSDFPKTSCDFLQVLMGGEWWAGSDGRCWWHSFPCFWDIFSKQLKRFFSLLSVYFRYGFSSNCVRDFSLIIVEFCSFSLGDSSHLFTYDSLLKTRFFLQTTRDFPSIIGHFILIDGSISNYWEFCTDDFLQIIWYFPSITADFLCIINFPNKWKLSRKKSKDYQPLNTFFQPVRTIHKPLGLFLQLLETFL